MRTQRPIPTCLAILLLIATLNAPARADNGPWRDGPDGGRGPLAIDKLVIGHYGPYTTLDVVFEAAVSPHSLSPRDFFLIDLDGTGDGKSDKWLVFGAPDGRWKSRSYNPNTKRVSRGGHWFEVRSPNTIRVFLAANLLPGPDEGYLFAAGSYVGSTPACASGCWDIVPNDGGWLIHDWTQPTVRTFKADRFASGSTPGTEVTWKVTDGGFATMVTSTLWWRYRGDARWTKLRTTKSRDLQTDVVPVEEGKILDLMVIARDSTGNRMKRTTWTTAPHDERAAIGDPEFFGVWAQEPREGAYLGSTSVSASPLDTFSFTGEGSYFCLDYLSAPDFGVARVQLGNEVVLIDQAAAPKPWQDPYCFFAPETGTHTMTVTVESGRINVDGFWFQ